MGEDSMFLMFDGESSYESDDSYDTEDVNDADCNIYQELYQQHLSSMPSIVNINSTTYFNALTLFDTGAYTSFVNREVARWLELQQHGGWSAPCSVQQTRRTYVRGGLSRHANE